MTLSRHTESKAELSLAGVWTDVTGDCYIAHGGGTEGFVIERGRPDEHASSTPGRCTFTLDNRAGLYSPRNPTGTYYGQLTRATPFRLSVPSVSDTFARTTAAGSWGTSSSGHAWTTSGTAADFSTDATYGKIAISATNSFRVAYTSQPADITQYATVRLSAQALTQSIVAGFVARYSTTADSRYEFKVFFNPTATGFDIDVAILKRIAGVGSDIATNTSTSLTYTSATDYAIRTECLGSVLKIKVWAASGSEPTTWTLETEDTDLTAAGNAGPYGYLTSGNTNALPLTLSFDNYESREVRFAGEVSSWPSRWDTTGTDVYVPTEASGVLRRLSQSAGTVRSMLRRYLDSLDHVAYWPMTDEVAASSFGSGDSGGAALAYTGTVTPGSFSSLYGSESLPAFATTATYGGRVAMSSSATAWSVGFALYAPSTPGSDTEICRWYTPGGTPNSWRITLTSSGTIRLLGYDSSEAVVAIFDTSYAFVNAITLASLFGHWCFVEVKATQNGANIDYTLSTHHTTGQSGGLAASDAGTMKAVTSIQLVELGSSLNGAGIGHVIVTDDGTGLGNLGLVMGECAETAGRRLIRVCDEQGVPCQIVGDPDDTVTLGLQRTASFLEVLRDCEEADGGILAEQRAALGVRYVTSRALGNQTPTAFSYATNELYGSLEPAEDDFGLVNDVTASRYNGSSVREVEPDGPLGTDTVGTYAASASVAVLYDSQLPDQASWRIHLGTYDTARYPRVGVHLGRSAFSTETRKRAATDLDIGAWLSITSPPAWLPPDTIEQVILGYTERIWQDGQSISWNCAPAGPYRLFTLADTDSTYGRLAYSGVTLNASLTTTATSVAVAIATGDALITTSGGNMPYDILIAGERMTVTACSGASSPQTLTVTRSVNGVVKTHAAAEEVQIWNPAYLALA